MKKIYQITLPYDICAGIITEFDIVVKTAPIFSWMIGKNIKQIESWVYKKQAKIIKV